MLTCTWLLLPSTGKTGVIVPASKSPEHARIMPVHASKSREPAARIPLLGPDMYHRGCMMLLGLLVSGAATPQALLLPAMLSICFRPIWVLSSTLNPICKVKQLQPVMVLRTKQDGNPFSQ